MGNLIKIYKGTSTPGDLPDPEIELKPPVSPALQVDSLSTKPSGKPLFIPGLLTNILQSR